MELVFLDNNRIQTQLVSVDGNIYYDIVTRFPATSIVPITTITPRRSVLPLKRVSNREFRDLPKPRDGEFAAKIEWKDRVRAGRMHNKYLDVGPDGKGCLSRDFLKRPHCWSLNDKVLFFTGNDGVKYQWKAHSYGTCILKRVHDDRDVAWGGKRRMSEGYFRGQIRGCLFIKYPEEVTLDLGMMLMTYLYSDHRRSMEELGVDWRPYHREDAEQDPELPFWPDEFKP